MVDSYELLSHSYPSLIINNTDRIAASPSNSREIVNLGTNKGRTLFVGNVDYAKERTLEEIDGERNCHLSF